MPAKNTHLRYGSVAMTLHWLIALAVIANICIGLYFSDLPRSDPSNSCASTVWPCRGSTIKTGRSPHFASGRAMTAALPTEG